MHYIVVPCFWSDLKSSFLTSGAENHKFDKNCHWGLPGTILAARAVVNDPHPVHKHTVPQLSTKYQLDRIDTDSAGPRRVSLPQQTNAAARWQSHGSHVTAGRITTVKPLRVYCGWYRMAWRPCRYCQPRGGFWTATPSSIWACASSVIISSHGQTKQFLR